MLRALEPDLAERAVAHVDAGHTAHARPQRRARALRRTLDFEHIATIGLGGHWRDARQRELQRLGTSHGGEQNLRVLTFAQRGHLLFLDLGDDAPALVGGNRHQLLAALERHAHGLSEVAGQDDAVHRCAQRRAVQLLHSQLMLALRLFYLGTRDHDRRGLVFGQRLAVLFVELRQLGGPLVALERQFTRIQAHQHLAGLDRLARTHLHRADKTIHRRSDDLLHRAFDACRRDDAVRARQEGQHRHANQRRADRRPRQRKAGTTEGTSCGRSQGLRDTVTDAVIGALFQCQQRAGEHRRVLGRFEGVRVEAAAALEQQRAQQLVARCHRHAVDRGVAAGLRERLVRQRDRRRGAGGQRMDDRQALVQRLGHGRGDAADGVVLLAHVGGAGNGDDAQSTADVQTEADALARQRLRQLVDDRRGRGVEVRLRQRVGLHGENGGAARRPHGTHRRPRCRGLGAGLTGRGHGGR